jgi:hypothetical protein
MQTSYTWLNVKGWLPLPHVIQGKIKTMLR